MSHLSAVVGTTDEPPLFTTTLRHAGLDAAWVRASGELDMSVVGELERSLDHGFAGASLVVLDLRGLTFLGSCGLHVIVDASAHARRMGRRLVVVAGPPHVHHLMDLTGAADSVDVIDPWAFG